MPIRPPNYGDNVARKKTLAPLQISKNGHQAAGTNFENEKKTGISQNSKMVNT